MSYTKLKNNSGFTIIEVLIVLAIAGLILLIVFLAVPALQRSARNTQRKNDVAAELGAMSEYADNNNGALPNVATFASGTLTFTLFGGPAGQANSTAKVGYYTVAPAITSTIPATWTSDSAEIVKGATCNGTAPATGSVNSYVAVWGVEGAGGTFTEQCTE